MSDPVFTADDYLRAEIVVAHLQKQRELHFDVHHDEIALEDAQKNFNERAALLCTAQLLLNEGERLLKEAK